VSALVEGLQEDGGAARRAQRASERVFTTQRTRSNPAALHFCCALHFLCVTFVCSGCDTPMCRLSPCQEEHLSSNNPALACDGRKKSAMPRALKLVEAQLSGARHS